MSNPNNALAKIYDIISDPVKGSEITCQEVELIEKIINKDSKILDIGGGTGRHTIQLAEKEYSITVVEPSRKMLEVLKQKISENNLKTKVKTYNSDIFKFKTRDQFDLIIMMWNTFNEIALTKTNAKTLLRKTAKMLKDEGKILINIDNSKNVDPSSFNHTFRVEREGLIYQYSWKTFKYTKKTNTSITKEIVRISNGENQVFESEAFIKQRYWSLDEVKDIANEIGFTLKEFNIKGNGELYLLLTS